MEINQTIDHTLLKTDATSFQIETLCQEAMEYQFKSVCVPPIYVKTASEFLAESNVLTCTVVGFPQGNHLARIKLAETKEAIKDGATEIDMVINVSDVKNKKFSNVQSEIRSLAEYCHEKSAKLKVIIETCLLTPEEIEKLTEIVFKTRADFIKTSTGMSTGGAKLSDVKLMKSTIDRLRKSDHDLEIKASGGIQSLSDAQAFLEAGATRLGMSKGVQVIQELNK